jgi:hypothetical protein
MVDKIRYFKIDPKDIAYLSHTIHAYEGLGVVRTLDPVEGVIEIVISPDFIEDMDDLFRALSREITLKEIDSEDIKDFLSNSIFSV